MSIEPSNVNKFTRVTTLKDGSKLLQIFEGTSTQPGLLLASTVIAVADWVANFINDGWVFVEALPSQAGGTTTIPKVADATSSVYTPGDLFMVVDPSSPATVIRAGGIKRVVSGETVNLTLSGALTGLVASDLAFRLPAGTTKNSDTAATALPNYNGDNPTLRYIG